MSQFAVVLEQFEPPPAEKLAILFQAVCGLPKIDAGTKAARAKGIVVEKVDGEVARKLQTALGNLKFPARVVPQGLVPEIVRGRRVRWISADAEQFSVRWTQTGAIDFYPWSDVLVVSAGVVYHKSEEQVLKTVRQSGMSAFLGRGGGASYTTEVSKVDTSCDMAMATVTLGRAVQQLQTLRLRAPELEYATMLDPATIRQSSLNNFCLVLARIGMHATSAQITDETIELIAAAQTTPVLPKSPRFASEEEFDQYQRWLVTRALQV
jgi:hypothetical protein